VVGGNLSDQKSVIMAIQLKRNQSTSKSVADLWDSDSIRRLGSFTLQIAWVS
jgi:hypothetical protein